MLLQSIGIEQATVAGDTRFDRVAKVVQEAPSNELANEFKGQHKVMVIGSAWPEDMHILIPFMNSQVGKMKFIVAPHEISESFMSSIEGAFTGRTMRYLQGRMELAASADLLMVDTIGLLAQLYRYGEFAFVGGGFKQGLHNTLEAACYGIPVFFGGTAPYDRYQEAIDLVALKGAFAITNTDELANCYEQLAKDPEAYRRASSACGLYVKENQGATGRITEYLVQILNAWKAE